MNTSLNAVYMYEIFCIFIISFLFSVLSISRWLCKGQAGHTSTDWSESCHQDYGQACTRGENAPFPPPTPIPHPPPIPIAHPLPWMEQKLYQQVKKKVTSSLKDNFRQMEWGVATLWQLQGLHGSYGVIHDAYWKIFICALVQLLRFRNCHEDPVTTTL